MNRNTNITINFYLNQGFLLFLFQNRMLEMTVRFISGEPFSALFYRLKGCGVCLQSSFKSDRMGGFVGFVKSVRTE